MSAARSRTVLLVEDEPMVRSMLQRHLRKQGMQVGEAANAELALEAYRERDGGYDVVITDVHLPGASGLDLALSIREQRPEQAIVFITGDVDQQLASQARAYKRSRFLLKPFEFFELDTAIRQSLNVSADQPGGASTAAERTEADWLAQQRRLLQAAAHAPVDVGLNRRPSKPRGWQLDLLLRLAVVTAILVLIAWGVGLLIAPDVPRVPVTPAVEIEKTDQTRTIYVPSATPDRQRPGTRDRQR